MVFLADKVLQGDRLALSRLISKIEDRSPDYQAELDHLFSHTGNAHIIGVTGPSGSGKSTLVNQLAKILAEGGNSANSRKVGIIAVDPTSPFSGGALLGDRVRMNNLTSNPNIFIRSMASRGALGGLADAADGTALAMDAAGFDHILIETVGAGQSEVEIARLAHTTIVVEAPGLGDEIQAAKAGILEIADILVVNKSDKDGAYSAAQALRSMLELGEELQARSNAPKWNVPVLEVSALNCERIDALAEIIGRHFAYLKESGEWDDRSQARLEKMLQRMIQDVLYETWNNSKNRKRMEEALRSMRSRQRSPYQIIEDIFS